jgi:hypothetical protein
MEAATATQTQTQTKTEPADEGASGQSRTAHTLTACCRCRTVGPLPRCVSLP